MQNWFFENSKLFVIFGIISFITFVGSIFLIPYLIIKIPENYFLYEEVPENLRKKIPTYQRILFHLAKNILGLAFVSLGLLMLITPGQGILAILIGVLLIDFPGKRRIERKIISNKKVFETLNYIRKKAGRASLKPPVISKK